MADRRVRVEDLDTIRQLATKYKPLYDADWLNTGNASVAYLVCISQGPWQQDRRFKLADRAIEELIRCTDPYMVDLRHAKIPGLAAVFPLEWQKSFIRYVVTALVLDSRTMHETSVRWMERSRKNRGEWPAIARELFILSGAKPMGSKVLWMFCRDFLQIPAFTIDRWVARRLREHGLSTNPWYMTRACLKAGVDPNELSRGLFSSRTNG